MTKLPPRRSAQSAPSWAGPELTIALVAGGIVALVVLVVGLAEHALSSPQALAAVFTGIGLLALSVGFRTTPLDLEGVGGTARRVWPIHRASVPQRGSIVQEQQPRRGVP